MPNHLIHTLKIRGDREEAAHCRFLVEDAFHTASLPGLPANGVVLIRRLDLGVVERRLSSAALSRRIDRLILPMGPVAVTAGAPEHPDAPAVWFPDSFSALAIFARLIASGIAPVSWYWPRIIGGWQPRLGLPSGASALLRTAAGGGGGPLPLSLLLENLLEAGCLDPFLDLLSPGELTFPYPEATPRLTPALKREAGSRQPQTLPLRWRRFISRRLRRKGKGEPQCRWVAAVLGISVDSAGDAVVPGRLSEMRGKDAVSPPVAAAGSYGAFSASAEVHGARGKGELSSFPAASETGMGVEAGGAGAEEREPLTGEALPATLSTAYQADRDALGESAASTMEDLPGTAGTAVFGQRPAVYGEFSAVAGLGLMIQLMEGFGISTLTAERAADGISVLPFLVLSTLADRMAAGEHDPYRRLFPVAMPGDVPLPAPVPQRFARFFPFADRQPVIPELLARGWCLAMARYLREHVRISLRGVVLRQGVVSVTPTHLDVTMDASMVDIRIRRAGLDLDPGWITWLGRVVSFHYRYDRW